MALYLVKIYSILGIWNKYLVEQVTSLSENPWSKLILAMDYFFIDDLRVLVEERCLT